MRTRKNRNGTVVAWLYAAIVIACFAGMLALGLGGCVPPDEEPIPQAMSEADLVPDEDGVGQAASALTSGEDPNPGVEAQSAPAAGYRYDRTRALWYIRRYALSPNRLLAYCSLNDGTAADCTNFASQVLWYGGIPMQYTNSVESGWWYRYSCLSPGSSHSWRQVNRLLQYLVTETGTGEFAKNARDLKIGDLIFYRLRHSEDGYSCNHNLFNHTTVVSGFDARGEPLVSYHSNEAHEVPWSVRNGSPKALGEACAVAFVHIRD